VLEKMFNVFCISIMFLLLFLKIIFSEIGNMQDKMRLMLFIYV